MKFFSLQNFFPTFAAILLVAAPGRAADYDPLATNKKFHAVTVDTVVHDATRGREIPVLIYLPTNTASAPVVIFSHGLGGSRQNNSFLGEHWAARGYVAVFTQHAGSDDGVWRNLEKRDRLAAMKSAASGENLKARALDIPAVLDALTRWNQTATNTLAGRLDLTKVGMSGHSFGAMTTEAVSGTRFPIIGTSWTDPRIRAAVAFSPSVPRGASAEKAFGTVKIPWLLMTGTDDLSIIGGADMKSRLGVYPALKNAAKYEVVLDKAEHSAFSDRALPGDYQTRNPNHHRVMLALTTAFWDAYLRGDPSAKAWLDGEGARGVLEASDRWQSDPGPVKR